jgi:hypothetical protein
VKLDAFFGPSAVRETSFLPELPGDLPEAVAAQFDRLPPHDLEAERCLIGAFVLAGDDKAAVAQVRAAVTAADFFSADYGAMFSAAAGLVDAGRPLDAVTLRAELASRGVLAEVGGVVHLADAITAVPSYASGRSSARPTRPCGGPTPRPGPAAPVPPPTPWKWAAGSPAWPGTQTGSGSGPPRNWPRN